MIAEFHKAESLIFYFLYQTENTHPRLFSPDRVIRRALFAHGIHQLEVRFRYFTGDSPAGGSVNFPALNFCNRKRALVADKMVTKTITLNLKSYERGFQEVKLC